MTKITIPFQIKHGTTAEWAADDPVLMVGEEGLDTTEWKKKTGDGVTAWSSLPWDIDAAALPAGGTTGQVLTKQSATAGDADWADPVGGSGISAGDQAKLDNISITQPVDLDQIEADVASQGTAITGHASSITANAAAIAANAAAIAAIPATRTRLTANTNLYVNASTGNDTNSGLSPAAAVQTITKAVAIAKTLDCYGFNLTIVVADGTYNENVVIDRIPLGVGTFTLIGNTTTPANCVINGGSGNCISIGLGVEIYVRGFKVTTSGGFAHGLKVDRNAFVFTGNMDFGSCTGMHIDLGTHAAIYLAYNYAITGGAVGHLHVGGPGQMIANPITVTLTGTPAFTAYFCGVANGNVTVPGMTFVGAATGPRYLCHKNGLIDVTGGGTSYFPGSTAGSTATGGQYIP